MRYGVGKGVQFLIALLQLGHGLTQGGFGLFARCDVAEVALDNELLIDPVDVADELDVQTPTVTGFKRQILVPEIAVALLLAESGPNRRAVFERADLPQPLAQKLATRIAQQLHQAGIDIGNPPGAGIEHEYPVRGSLKQPSVTGFRNLQYRCDSLALDAGCFQFGHALTQSLYFGG